MDGRRVVCGMLTLLCALRANAGELGIVRIVCDHGSHAVHFTGTHVGNGLILTCGHCCRDAGGPGSETRIVVLSSRTWQPVRQTRGTVLCSDQEEDVGLIRLKDPDALDVAYRLAPRGSRFRPREQALLYRWQERDDGRRLRSKPCRVTRIDPFQGLHTTEVACPVRPGDSGGPIVSARTRLVMGVASGVIPEQGRAVYSGLEPVYALLEDCAGRGERVAGDPRSGRQRLAKGRPGVQPAARHERVRRHRPSIRRNCRRRSHASSRAGDVRSTGLQFPVSPRDGALLPAGHRSRTSPPETR